MNFRSAAQAMRGASRVVLAAILGGLLVTAALPTGAGASTSALPSRYVAVGPTRLADTRPSGAFGFTRLDSNTIRVQVAGAGGVPADATAASLTVTAIDPRGAGFVTVYPTGTPRQETANVNFNGPGEIVANGAIVALGSGGAIDIFVQGGAQLVVDVSGAFQPTTGAVAAGRYVGLSSATRLLDTRNGGGRVGAGGTRRIARPTGVPADATAVVVNIAITESGGAGFITAWPAGRSRPLTSVLNTERAMQTRSATSIVPVTSSGFDVYSMSGGHIVVDLAGYFTGASAGAASSGLFVPVAPNRILDTRGTSALGTNVRLQPGWTVEVPAPVSGSALVYNLVTADAPRAGYITAYPAGGARAETANVNAVGPGAAVGNLAITTMSNRGVAFYSMGGEHIIADMTGYFTGSPVGAPNPTPVNPGPVLPATPAGCETENLDRLNGVRAANGVGSLAISTAALNFACQWSAQMAATGNFAHSSGTARSAAVGGCGNGENIAAGSLNYDLFQLWIDSPPHFQNMVYPGYTHAAIGYVTVNGVRYGTMVLVIAC